MFDNTICRRDGWFNSQHADLGPSQRTLCLLNRAWQIPHWALLVFITFLKQSGLSFFMFGGVSQVDSFDYKPLLAQRDGELLTFHDARQLAKTGKATEQMLLNTPWKFKRHGQSGRWVSELFPGMAEHVDDLCFLHGMHTEGVAHGPATLFLHCGSTNIDAPVDGFVDSIWAWVENEDLPALYQLHLWGWRARRYGAAFLPPKFQGTVWSQPAPIASRSISLTSPNRSVSEVARQVELLQRLNRQQLDRRSHRDAELETALESQELAWRMQQIAPDVLDCFERNRINAKVVWPRRSNDQVLWPEMFAGAATMRVRRTLRCSQLWWRRSNWDQHSDIPKHAEHAKAVDRPISGLLHDLKQRGLLEDTIVWWGGEFGRTPIPRGKVRDAITIQEVHRLACRGRVQAGICPWRDRRVWLSWNPRTSAHA